MYICIVDMNLLIIINLEKTNILNNKTISYQDSVTIKISFKNHKNLFFFCSPFSTNLFLLLFCSIYLRLYFSRMWLSRNVLDFLRVSDFNLKIVFSLLSYFFLLTHCGKVTGNLLSALGMFLKLDYSYGNRSN